MPRTIATNVTGGLTLTNTGDSPVYIAQGVSIGNASGPALTNGVAYYWSVTNGANAHIAGSNFGVALVGAGTVVNRGTMSASYVGYGFYYNTTSLALVIESAGLYVGGGGVSNSPSGVVSGAVGVALGGIGSVVNAGAIEGSVPGKGFGVALDAGGSVTNLSGGAILGGSYGLISVGAGSVSNQSIATVSGTIRGVWVIRGTGSVGNQGNISGGTYGVELSAGGAVNNQSGGAISGGFFGVLITNGSGTVTNQGSIVNTGTAQAGVYLSDGGTIANQLHGVIDGADYGIRMGGTVGTVANLGTIDGTADVGILLLAGGTVDNLTSGTGAGYVTGNYDGVSVTGGPGYVTNQGLITNQTLFTTQTTVFGGVIFADGGSLNNSGTILSGSNGVRVDAAAGTIVNSGSIYSARTIARGAAVNLHDGGSVTNSGTITSKYYGVYVSGGSGEVTNSGTIFSARTSAAGGIAMTLGGSVTNNAGGVIAGEWIGVQFGLFPAPGVTSTQAPAGTFVNNGTVSAADGAGDGAAVWVHGPGLVINNAGGVIEGSANGTVVGGPLNGLLNGGFGVVTYYQTTLINFGSIGGSAFAFDASNAGVGNRVEMAPGATFGGVVLGAHNTASAGLSTLELLSGASAGTVSNFGTHYKYFGNVTLDNGARWTLGGTVVSGTTVAFAGTGELTLLNSTEMQGTFANFGQGDTIVIDGISVTGSGYAGGVLTLTEAAGGPVLLNLPGTFATGDFVVTNVSGNAEISLPRTLSWTGGGATAAFDVAANWDDISNGLNPAQTAPSPTDTVEFNTIGGAVTGTGTVAVLQVGSTGTGALQLSGGATLVAGSLDAGGVASSVGQIGLTGAGTELMVTGAATVGDDGTGVLSVLSGATFSGTNLTIGAQTDSSGAMVVSGDGSVVNLTGALNIGTALGTGDLTVGPGAAIHAGVINQFGQVVDEGGLLDPTVLLDEGTDGGTGTIASDFIIDEGTIAANSKKAANGVEVVSGTVVGGGTLTISGGTTLDGTTQNSPGLLLLDNIGTLEVQGPVLNAADTTFIDNGTPTGAVTVFGTYDIANSVVDVTFLKANEVLVLDDISGFAGTVTTTFGGDKIVITGGTLSNLGVSNGTTLTMSDSGNGGTDRIMFAGPVSAAGFNIVSGNTLQVVSCFARGTRIATASGPVLVEHLTLGMRVPARRGGTAEIVWIGQRDIECRQHPDPGTVYPVRVLAGAFGPGIPSRDLWLSPDHAVFVEGVLIPIHCLINGGTIRQMTVPAVTYYHVELPEHDVILAEGLPVESYLDTGNRANFSNCGGSVRLFPDFSARMWEMAGCAPLVMTGPVLQRVWEALARGEAVIANGTVSGSVPRRTPWTRLNNRYTYY